MKNEKILDLQENIFTIIFLKLKQHINSYYHIHTRYFSQHKSANNQGYLVIWSAELFIKVKKKQL